jgi:thymidylate kinase
VTKVIVIRGNSGSGKTSAARRLRAAILERGASSAVAVVEQDYFRRVVLKEKEEAGAEALNLIRVVAAYTLARGFDVIVEGILGAAKYGEMLGGLMSLADESYAFYFDVSFEETVRRTATKNAEFGEPELRTWWKEHDVLGVDGETLLPESLSLDDAVAVMLDRAYS